MARDDFKDLNRLSRTLSRERSKDMAQDYDGAKDFAERRDVGFRERVIEIVPKLPEHVRGVFDGLDLGQRAKAPQPPPVDYRAEREVLRNQAIRRHAGAAVDILRMR